MLGVFDIVYFIVVVNESFFALMALAVILIKFIMVDD